MQRPAEHSTTTASPGMIDPRVPPPKVVVVDPCGRIRSYTVARNVTHFAVDHAGQITADARSIGWSTMVELYEQERDAEGLAAWQSFLEAKARGMAAAFPDELLPEAVRQRRKHAAPVPEWVPPKRKGKSKPKSGVSKAKGDAASG